MPIITLLTDFGAADEYVGVMKGVILSVNPSATIVDITHHVDPQDLIEAAYIIESAYKYFPNGTVHVVVIDPGVGTDRAIIALETDQHTIIAPNNGVLTLAVEEKNIDYAVRVDNPDYFLKSVSQTFHGRDIYAPISAYLSMGVAMNHLGTSMDPKNLVRLNIQKSFISEEGELVGTIITLDRFGNLITNIDAYSLKRFCNKDAKKKLAVMIGDNKIIGLAQNYQTVSPQSPLALIGSRGYLEIAVNCGNAKSFFKAKKGDVVRAMLSD